MSAPHGLENQMTLNPTVDIRCPKVFPFGGGWCSELTVNMFCEPIKARLRAWHGHATTGSGAAPHAWKTLSPLF